MNDDDYITSVMASVSSPTNSYTVSANGYDTVTIANTAPNRFLIRGDMCTVSREIDMDVIQRTSPKEIKAMMIAQIVGELINKDCVLFTKQIDHSTGRMRVNARIFAVPNDQVQTLVKSGF